MVIEITSKPLFLKFVNEELQKTENREIYYTIKNSGIDIGNGFQNKLFTFLFFGNSFAFIYKEKFPIEKTDEALDSIYKHINNICDFQELNSITVKDGTLILD
ncbi:hypothetical protein [Oceanobacillus kimchii]|uniref:hypothetical protein n=1 Tax=Oceanobacillus kimchii TaxID=746691 RepID=UPI003B01E105